MCRYFKDICTNEVLWNHIEFPQSNHTDGWFQWYGWLVANAPKFRIYDADKIKYSKYFKNIKILALRTTFKNFDHLAKTISQHGYIEHLEIQVCNWKCHHIELLKNLCHLRKLHLDFFDETSPWISWLDLLQHFKHQLQCVELGCFKDDVPSYFEDWFALCNALSQVKELELHFQSLQKNHIQTLISTCNALKKLKIEASNLSADLLMQFNNTCFEELDIQGYYKTEEKISLDSPHWKKFTLLLLLSKFEHVVSLNCPNLQNASLLGCFIPHYSVLDSVDYIHCKSIDASGLKAFSNVRYGSIVYFLFSQSSTLALQDINGSWLSYLDKFFPHLCRFYISGNCYANAIASKTLRSLSIDCVASSESLTVDCLNLTRLQVLYSPSKASIAVNATPYLEIMMVCDSYRHFKKPFFDWIQTLQQLKKLIYMWRYPYENSPDPFDSFKEIALPHNMTTLAIPGKNFEKIYCSSTNWTCIDLHAPFLAQSVYQNFFHSTTLRTIQFTQGTFTDEDIQFVCQNCPLLETLKLLQCKNLSRLHLKSASVYFINITGENLQQITVDCQLLSSFQTNAPQVIVLNALPHIKAKYISKPLKKQKV